MSKQKALEEIFEIKKKYLQNVPHPKLIDKGIKQLKRLLDEEVKEIQIEFKEIKDLSFFLQNYIDELMKLKLHIANSQNAKELLVALQNLRFVHLHLIKVLGSYVSFELERTENLKMSDPFDAYAILKILEKKELKEKEISDYIRSQFNEKEEEADVLVLSCIRARKILDHG